MKRLLSRLRLRLRGPALVALGFTLALQGLDLDARAEQGPSLTVFPAKKILTMDPRYPEARFVVVRKGMIVAIGRKESDLAPWLSGTDHEFDRRFEDRILLPGFVDPHIHPLLAAVFLPHFFATPDDWTFPSGTVSGVVGRAAFLDRVRQGNDQLEDPSEWLLVFGWARAAHGTITRSDLDAISRTRPIAVSSRSTHSMILNSKAMAELELTPERVAKHSIPEQVDYENGFFTELANFQMVVPRLAPILFAPERIARGLRMFRDMAHAAGITTVCEPGTGLVAGGGDAKKEFRMMAPVLDREDTPFRTYLFPAAYPSLQHYGDRQRMLDAIAALPESDGRRIHFLPKHIKFLYDGSYVDQLGIYDPPGYIDGHEGVRIDPPDVFSSLLPVFWRAGFSIHVHVQGDGGARRTVEALAALQEEKPRFDPRFILEHLPQASQETLEKASRLGASVSALMYPLYSMGDPFAERVLGNDRMEMAFPYRESSRLGMHVALHSDTPVAPPNPLRNAWIATSRRTRSGRVIGKRQSLTVHDALRAITIEAAYMLGLENEIGSIRPGKKADFAVLEDDPQVLGGEDLEHVRVWGTVLEGRVQPLAGRVGPASPRRSHPPHR
ncbi:MAG TPA: hypothetical protein ENI85_11175 [Deltaproteobacteria bacterium]|nr:hypothetical protein [Deltaproteobacteria bacterium]